MLRHIYTAHCCSFVAASAADWLNNSWGAVDIPAGTLFGGLERQSSSVNARLCCCFWTRCVYASQLCASVSVQTSCVAAWAA